MTSQYSRPFMLFFFSQKLMKTAGLSFETSAPQTLMYQLKKATYNPKTHLISQLLNNPYIFLTLEEMLFFVHYLEVPNFETINTDKTKVIESEPQERRSFRMSSIFIYSNHLATSLANRRIFKTACPHLYTFLANIIHFKFNKIVSP